jgi:hypothetical protein
MVPIEFEMLVFRHLFVIGLVFFDTQAAELEVSAWT